MNSGKWYFVYSYRDTFDGDGDPLFGPVVGYRRKEILLDAATEVEAIAQANTMWAKVKEEAEGQEKPEAHPPIGLLESGPYDPCVIYRIPL